VEAGDAPSSSDTAPASDGPLPGDAGSRMDAPSSWCSGDAGHTFCEDFDEYANVTALEGAWSSFQAIGGTLGFDTTNAPSPPNALEVTGGNGAQVLVVKTFPLGSPPASLRLDFDLRFNSTGSVGLLSAAGLASIAFGNALADGYAALAIGNGPTLAAAWAEAADAGASDGGTFKTSASTGPFPAAGTWAGRYSIEVTYTSTGGCVQVYEGVTALLSPCLALPSRLLHPASVAIALGDYTGGVGNTGAINVEFDNVTFDIK